ncbi:MAG: transketolase C-terminal domain-containing protein [SAR202 cluster bacterium]|nr:transketolase C-terminal domain-containing protein [SAR202 cluster bacterium]
MRNAFARSVSDLADDHSAIILLAGDIGNRLFDGYKEHHPDRFYNCGVAEAGMIGIAGGLAASGLHPITYTITPFNTMRCLEQIRLDICYPNYPAIIVGTGAGLSYAGLGATHHSMEDIGLMRMLPNMHVVCPGDATEVELAVRAAVELERPVYIRLGKKGEPQVHSQPPEFKIGKGVVLENGTDVALLGVGNMLSVANEVSAGLKQAGISTSLVSLHTIKPLDDDLLAQLFFDCNKVVVIEEHGLAGGAGSAILEWANAKGVDASKVVCFGAKDAFLTACGNQQEARCLLNLNAESIICNLQEHF